MRTDTSKQERYDAILEALNEARLNEKIARLRRQAVENRLKREHLDNALERAFAERDIAFNLLSRRARKTYYARARTLGKESE